MRSNTQGELSALERGMHALRRPDGMDVKAYAESVGKPRESVRNEVYAAEVASVAHVGHDLSGYFRHLMEVHAAQRWLCPALVEGIASVSEGTDYAERVRRWI